MNNIIVTGRLTRPLDLKQTQGGTSYIQSNIAVPRDKKKGEDKAQTDFINFSIFGKSAEYLNNYADKGSKVLLMGRLEINCWQTQDGQQRRDPVIMVDKVEILEFKQEAQSPAQAYQAYEQEQQQTSQQQLEEQAELDKTYSISDEDLPF